MRLFRPSWWWLAAALAVGTRLAGIQWGLPNTPNADEPHLVNLAVSFGGGSLKPYSMKYPTLWPYMLAAAYGVYFAVWSVLGLRRGVAEFVGFFAWHPGSFYLIGRLMAATFSLLGLYVIWRTEKERGKFPWAALLLAFAPVLVELAHAAKADCAMFFFACLAWRYALQILEEGGRRAHWLAGASIGAALACQYSAYPLAAALPAAHFAARLGPPRRWLLEGIAAAFAALFVGSPYIFLDFHEFLAHIGDMGAFWGQRTWSEWYVFKKVVSNALTFAGPGSIAGAAALAGLWRLSRQDARRAFALSAPILLYIATLSRSPDGVLERYMFGAYPALALLAAEGLRWATSSGRPAVAAVIGALALGPGLYQSARMDMEMRLPDTRAAAEEWIKSSVPQGSALLLDLPHASPDLRMVKEQVIELAERTKRAGSPRSRLYAGMAQFHPGGGYRIYRIARRFDDLASGPRHVQRSQGDAPTLDVVAGLGAARAAGVEYVVTSSYGATPQRSPELKAFFEDLRREGRLLQAFEPASGKVTGPTLAIFSVKNR